MSQNRILATILAATLCLQSGCALVEPMRASMKMFKPNSNDYRDGTDETEDNWSFVGTEARGERAMEKNGPLERLMMSPKARSITRNVGIE